jgi:hypothetical protein
MESDDDGSQSDVNSPGSDVSDHGKHIWSGSLSRLNLNPKSVNHSESRHTMSLSRHKGSQGGRDSESESEIDDNHSPKERRRGSIFKDLLHGKAGRAGAKAKSNGNSPMGSEENLNSTGRTSESDSEVDHHARDSHHGSASSLFKNIMGGSKQRKASGAASSNKSPGLKPEIDSINKNFLPLPPPASSSLSPTSDGSPLLQKSSSETSLSEKYGTRSEILGKGASAVVRLCSPGAFLRLFFWFIQYYY